MTLFSKQEWQALTQTQSSPCVSIFLPTHEAGREIQQDPIRLKNQIAEARDRMQSMEIDSSEIQSILKPAEDLLEQSEFWQHQSNGLALFLSPDQFRYYRVPAKFETQTIVGKRPYTQPLMPLMVNDAQFYIVAASQNKVALYQATRDSVQPVDLGTTPLSLETALRYDDGEPTLQGHTTSRAGTPTGGQRVYDGQGSGKDSENTDILRFFHLVTDGVEAAIGGQSVPLVFVGLDFLFPLYKSANKYPHLMEDAVDYQPDTLSPEEIRDRAIKIVEPHFNADRKAASENYGNLLNKNQSTDDLETVLNAAFNGQIDTLFMAKGEQAWGNFEAKDRVISYTEASAENSEDLLNLAASKAIETDAKVYVVDQSDMPSDSAVAATLRYPIMRSELVNA